VAIATVSLRAEEGEESCRALTQAVQKCSCPDFLGNKSLINQAKSTKT
jgi:hypothetical protein